MVGGASADIQFANVTTTVGDVTVEADDHSSITATESTVLNSEGKAGTLMAAFNVIGWSNDNFGSLAVDAILGSDTLLGTATPDATKAFIDASIVTAARGVSVTALGAANITASAGDKAGTVSSLDLVFSAKDGPSALNVGGVLVTNKVLTQTQAYIDNGTGTTTVHATTGNIQVTATDHAGISANSTIDLTAAAISNESALYQVAIQLAHQDYLYTDKSGSQFLSDGDRVYAGQDSDGAPLIYQYKGPTTTPDGQGHTVPLSVNLGIQQYATDTDNWTKIEEGAPTVASLLPNFGNLTNAGSKAVGLIFVLNDARGEADATVTGATLTAGQGIGLAASETAAILAVSQNTVTSSGGNSGLFSGAGVVNGSLAANGTVVTNLVLASALASAELGFALERRRRHRDQRAERGADGCHRAGLLLDHRRRRAGGRRSRARLQLDRLGAGEFPVQYRGRAPGRHLPGRRQPCRQRHGLHPQHQHRAGHRRSQRHRPERRADQRHDQQRRDLDRLGAVRRHRRGFGGVVASNKVNGKANAYIDESGLNGGAYAFSITGNLLVKATDASGIYSNAKLVSSSTVTNDGGAGLLQNEINAATPADLHHRA